MKMTGFARLIVVFCIFFRFAFSMENSVKYKGISKYEDYSVAFTTAGYEIAYKSDSFEQKLDHFATINSETWKQKYFIVGDYYKEARKSKKKSPVLLMLGGQERIKIEDLVNKRWITLCLKFKALCLVPEHRFYGEIQPTNDTSDANLRKYLNIDQVLGDIEYFIRTMKDDWKLTSQNKWILFGCEYAGTLAAVMRVKYPELVDGVVASSAYFPMDFFLPEYYDNVGNKIKEFGENNYGLQCYNKINQAFIKISKQIDYSNIHNLKEPCDYLKFALFLEENFNCNDNFQINLLFQEITKKIFSIVQNEQNLKLLCDSLIPDSEWIIEQLGRGLKEIYNTNDYLFIAADYEKVTNDLRQIDWGSHTMHRLKKYQQCTELGSLPWPATNNQPFIYRLDKKFLFKYHCGNIFGLDYNSIEETDDDSIEPSKRVNFFYYNTYRYHKYSNTVFIDGKIDLLFEVRMSKFNPSSNTVITIEGAYPCEDIITYGKNTKPRIKKSLKEIKKAQKEIKKLIKKWINE